MKQADFADRQRELAAIDRQIADLLVRRASIHDELAGVEANPRTGRQAPRRHVPSPPTGPVSALDKARAAKALQELENRRSVRR